MSILLGILFIGGASYALWQMTLIQEEENIVKTGCFNIEFQEQNSIHLESSYPLLDEEGKTLTPYTFTITNTCDTLVKYQINLEVLNKTTFGSLEYIKTMFQEENPLLLTEREEVSKTLDNARKAYLLETGVLSKLGSKTFSLRMWLDENTLATEDVMNRVFNSKVTVTTILETDRYTEDLLNGADPVLKDELIPVTIASDGTVTKANIKEKWYSYENKEWANAVILKDKTKSIPSNTIIKESDIESYFVWIPRYRYQIFNEIPNNSSTIDISKVNTINIAFETTDVPVSNGTKNGEWLTHPAFTSFNINGFWVGKFETSKANTATENSTNPMGVQIKPNESSWCNIQAGNAFYSSYYYHRNLDSHMIKNTEWGAVAYLQHSKYGSHTRVRINNHSDYKTGHASTKEPTCDWTYANLACNKWGNTQDITLPYNTEVGHLASTTGNITGVYDMSGGAWEFAMGIVVDSTGQPLSGFTIDANSGLIGSLGNDSTLTTGYNWPQEKYYDTYQYGTGYTEYVRRILGDATGEMSPFQNRNSNNHPHQIGSWYINYSHFAMKTSPWFVRGGHYEFGTSAGLFAFSGHTGGVAPTIGFRVTLAPE